MQNWAKFTKIFILTTFIVVICIDIILALNGMKGDTISEVTRDGWKYTGGIFFAIGFLLAHLGWYREKYINIAISMSVLLVGGVLCGLLQSIILIPAPIVYVMPGVPLGYIFWPQKPPKGL